MGPLGPLRTLTTAVISIEDSSVRDLESVVLFNGRRTGEKDRKEEGKEIWHMVAP